MAERRVYSSLSQRQQQRWTARGRAESTQEWGPTLTGSQARRYAALSPSYRSRLTGWSRQRGLNPAQVWADPETRRAMRGDRRAGPVVDPLAVVRRPWGYARWLSGHRRLAQTVSRSKRGHAAFDAQVRDSATPIRLPDGGTTGIPANSLIDLGEQGITGGHVRDKTFRDLASVLEYLRGLHAQVAGGVVFAVATFDAALPWALWWGDSP